MFKAMVLLTTFLASHSYADSERLPAAFSTPSEIRAEISRLKSKAIGKDGKPNQNVIDKIAEYENKEAELDYKRNKRSKR